MLNTALKDFPKAEISGYEISLSRAVYSYETLNYFQSKFPRSEIYSLVGSDSLANIHLWKNFRYIIQKYKFLAVKRKGTEYFDCDGYKGNCRFLKGEVDEISSTAVRKLLKDGEKNLLQFLDKEVAEYIFQNNLYK
jgi:nicotinate-nucleotide adenylyltransferase